MDHTIALRQEVAALSQQLQAIGQVVEATGQATGALYTMFHEQTTATNQGATYQAQEDFSALQRSRKQQRRLISEIKIEPAQQKI